MNISEFRKFQRYEVEMTKVGIATLILDYRG
nr:MAG TPA: hypothetical protein [Caudoviricetes sp.]